MIHPSFPAGNGTTTYSVTNRLMRTVYILGQAGDIQDTLQVVTMHSKGRKAYATTVGRIDRKLVDEGHVDAWSPMDDVRLPSVPAARFSKDKMLDAHLDALAQVMHTEDPRIVAKFAPQATAA